MSSDKIYYPFWMKFLYVVYSYRKQDEPVNLSKIGDVTSTTYSHVYATYKLLEAENLIKTEFQGRDRFITLTELGNIISYHMLHMSMHTKSGILKNKRVDGRHASKK